MRTIVERAKEFAQSFVLSSNDMCCTYCDVCPKCKEYDKFVDIVTEQRDIDIEKACNVFCHTGCPHKIDSYNCLNDKCDTWKIFRRMLEE